MGSQSLAYGTVQIGNQTFIEREQSFPLEVSITTVGQVVKQSLNLPGTADFWLKALMRETTEGGVSTARRFKFRFGNSDGSTWYQSGGTGNTTDRVIDTLIFGSGQFPFVLNPYIYYSASASIMYEIEDISGVDTDYTIYFSFRGSYLIPVS
jgi:hypothetical protein